jgi:leucyl-tRNA synthetase
MDTFVCSSWYFLRYADPQNKTVFADPAKLKEWLPVDLYFGGAEHTVLHLLYARFFTKVLRKYGYLDFDEPFLRLRHQGIILGEDGNKMSKSKGNVVNPDSLTALSGADALRLYEMFMGPLEEMKPWNSQGISGVSRFLDRVERIFDDSPRSDDEGAISFLQQTIKKVSADIDNFKFNTAISALMIFVNYLYEAKNKKGEWPLANENLGKFLRLLEPFAPHLAEELWERLGQTDFLALSPWPEYQPELVKVETFILAVQVNGKLRASLSAPIGLDEEAALVLAKANPVVAKWLEGTEIVRQIYVPEKLLNLVTRQA